MAERPWHVMVDLWVLLSSATEAAGPTLDALGLPPKAFFVLSSLQHCASPSELARVTQSPPSTITSVLKALEARGYAERGPVPGDLRRFNFALTPGGRDALARGEAAMDEAFGRRLAKLSADEREGFASALRRMLALEGRADDEV